MHKIQIEEINIFILINRLNFVQKLQIFQTSKI